MDNKKHKCKAMGTEKSIEILYNHTTKQYVMEIYTDDCGDFYAFTIEFCPFCEIKLAF